MRRALFQQIGPGGLAVCAGAALLVASCASSSPDAGGGSSDQIIALSEGEGSLALERKFAMQKGDVSYDEHGGVSGGKRSQYEGMKQVQFGGEWNGKSYDKKQYEKRSWWGSKKAPVKQYEGGEDASRFQTASRYSSRNARQDGQRSRFDGTRARTATYRTAAATEAGAAAVAKPSDAKTDWRRDVYPQPRIIGYKDYQKQTIEETRSLLGRDD